MNWGKTMALVLFIGVALLAQGCPPDSGQDQSDSSQSRPSDPRLQCAQRFVSMDANYDTKVTPEEFATIDHPEGNAKDVFASKDADGDGILTIHEMCVGKGADQGKKTGQQANQ